MTILLTGGTGKTALPTARRLRDSGHSVLLACRSGIVPTPYRGVVFNWFDSKTFNAPFDLDSNIDRVYLVCPYAPDMLGMVKPFIELAISKGVKRFVLLSSTRQVRGGSHMGKIHEYIEDRSVEWAVIRPTWFMENCIPTSMRDGRVPFIAADDIAELVYHALIDEKSHNTDHIIVGPDAYTHDKVSGLSQVANRMLMCHKAAAIFSGILGRKVEHVRLPEERGIDFWTALGLPENAAQFMVVLEHQTAQGSCEHEIGSLPIPPSETRGRHVFPHNVSFRTADWVATRIPEDMDGYDVVIAFSISKWIHLNGGDAAIDTFFRRVYDVLKPGGIFVLEPQAWDTYAKAKRMDERLKENANKLRMRPEDFKDLLGTIGFGPAQHYGVTGEGGWGLIELHSDNADFAYLVLSKPISPSIQHRYKAISRRFPLLTNGHKLGGQHEQSRVESMPIGDAFLELMVKAWDSQHHQKRESLSPKPILAALGRKYDQYLDFAQQDAHEFLLILLDASRMEELDVSQFNPYLMTEAEFAIYFQEIKKRQPLPNEVKKRRRTTITPSHLSSQSSPLPPSIPEEEKLATLSDTIFGGKFASILVCRECKHVSTTYEDFNDISLSIRAEDYPARKRDFFKSLKRRAFQTSSLRAINEVPRPSSVPPSPLEELAGHEEPVSVSLPRRRSFDVVHGTSNDQDSDTSPSMKEDSAALQEPPVDSPDDSKGKFIETPLSAKSDKFEKKDKIDGWASIGRRISFSVGKRKTRSHDRNKKVHPSPEASQTESAENGVLSLSASEDVPTVEIISPAPTVGKEEDGSLLIARTSSSRPVTPPSHSNVLSHLQTPRACYPTRSKSPKPTTAELNYLREVLPDVAASSSHNPFAFLKSSSQNQGNRSVSAPGSSQNLWPTMNRLSGIEECLRMFTSVEILDGENMVECHRCWKIANGEYKKLSSEDDDTSDEDSDDAEQDSINVDSQPVDIPNCRPKSPPTDPAPFRPVALTNIPTSISTPTVSLYTHSNPSEYPTIPSLPTTAPSSIHESDLDALPPSVKDQPPPLSTPGNSPIPSSSSTGPDPYPIPSLIVRSSSLPIDDTPVVAHPVPRLGQVLNHLPAYTHQPASLSIPKSSHGSDGDESSETESDTSITTSVRSAGSSTSVGHVAGTIPPVKKPKQVIMRPAYKRYLIGTPPPVLIIHLKRFQQINKTHALSFSHGFKKVDDSVAFPEFLDLAPYLAPRKEDFGLGKKRKSNSDAEGTSSGLGKQTSRGEKCIYRLYAVIVHIGNMVRVSTSLSVDILLT
ncbi:hypothetical protein C0993_001192 [Termitomyces sp. T159_Od127]|nr:hypothetical protein C0993_001192 [Termitomyces sp. T159_Od127]